MEMVVLQRAIRRVRNGKDGLINIFSNSRSSLKIRVHGEISKNDRADELARRVDFTKKTAADYDKFPLSHAKKVIRAASLEERQQRYTEGSTVKITKCFFPREEKAYSVLQQIGMTSLMAQFLTGDGEFAQYLFRFRLQD
ncbi:hypothetical protein EVAR_74892_1 [Eumeta japonica]|uniref:RNase H type-1 domain-containing protein n=1 Tax=Eumeta variegata TaxID=151549 RepID=A0A4C1Z270_EUMVA|nr:hypothetical protein EVAR_74892_1 [Eumeta japonica]